ncbi:TolC family protein [Hyphococcus sp.]|uniref:TolC family protein n=1 Tax=Hyphococcus sp. TaxID=2038636 RepID=UPI002087555E|nr:MAG: copper transporter [Marinicaulis sp.]
MSKQYFAMAAAIAAVLMGSVGLASGPPLTLQEAVNIAVTAEDPAYARFDARASAQEDRAVSDSQLPDPTLRTALANVPTDTFAFDQEPMTQFQVGLRQEIPRGSTRSLNRERREGEADIERMRREATIREVELAVRLAWFDKYYASNAQLIVNQSRGAVNSMIDALSASYAQGKLTSQDVFRAEFELSLLDDKIAELQQRRAAAEADLSRYVGIAAVRPTSDQLPALMPPAPVEEIERALVRHPVVRVSDAMIDVEETDIDLAKQAYKPAWALEGGYGARGADRADFASVGVSLTIPLFTGKRQDRALSAARKDKSAAELDRATTLLDMRRDLVRAYANWGQLERRVQLYDNAVLKRANETADASLSAYGGGLTDFPELIRSQLAQLDAELKRLELRVERAKAWARLSYLSGDNQ